MADIKTRDVTRGSIKTLDRTVSSMHHLKEATIRIKTADIDGRYDYENVGTYAQDTAEHYAGDGAAYASRAGVELIQRSRGQNSAYPLENAEYIQRFGIETPKTTNNSQQSAEQIQRAFREEGIRKIIDRRNRSKMASEEVLRNTEADRRIGRIRRSSASIWPNGNSRSIGRNAKNRQNAPKTENMIARRRKEYAVARMMNRKDANIQILVSLFRPGRGKSYSRRASTASHFLRFIWENARTAVFTAGAGGAAAVIILTLFVLFGIGMITFSNNSPDTSVTEDPEAIEYFIPDLSGSPTREAIVKAASREVGNVGGEKFWRWYGFKSHVHWCACFTSYIAAECGCIQSGVCPRSALVDDWISFYKKQHRWAGRNYIPHSGDFIIFDWEGDGQPDHIGIVESCDGKTVYTIEGNSRDVCRRKSYARGSWLIYGYGCPNYSGR